MSETEKSETKSRGLALDMHTVFFGIVAVAFGFMALGTFFPAHQRLLHQPIQTIQSTQSLEGTIVFEDFKCDDGSDVEVLQVVDDNVTSRSKPSYIDSQWQYSLPVSTMSGYLLVHCENSAGKEA